MIMDDNRIMEAAKLIANSSAALIQAIGMMSENIERANRGESLAYNGFSTYMESDGIVNRIMMFKDKNEMRDRRIKSIL